MAVTGRTISATTLIAGPSVSNGSVPAGPFFAYRIDGSDDLELVYNASGSSDNLVMGYRLTPDGTISENPVVLFYLQDSTNFIEYGDFPQLQQVVAGMVTMTTPMSLSASLISGSVWRQEDYASLYRLIVEMCD